MQREKWFKRIPSLRKEIVVTLLFKTALITLIWFVCFSDPISKHLTSRSYLHHFITTPAQSSL